MLRTYERFDLFNSLTEQALSRLSTCYTGTAVEINTLKTIVF
jgi:hypothetical protein